MIENCLKRLWVLTLPSSSSQDNNRNSVIHDKTFLSFLCTEPSAKLFDMHTSHIILTVLLVVCVLIILTFQIIICLIHHIIELEMES